MQRAVHGHAGNPAVAVLNDQEADPVNAQPIPSGEHKLRLEEDIWLNGAGGKLAPADDVPAGELGQPGDARLHAHLS